MLEDLGMLNRDILSFLEDKKIAIVGNSTITEEDQDRIEESDFVIRFNNFATRQGLDRTRNPMRCEMLFTTLDLHSAGCQPCLVAIGVPFPFKQDRVRRLIQKWYPDSSVVMVNPYLNAEMCKELLINSEGYKHPFPSIGFTGLWHLAKLFKEKKPNIYVCGFTWYYDSETNLFQGVHLKEPGRSHWNHNYHKELKWCMTHQHIFKYGPLQQKLFRIAQDQMSSK